MLLKLQLACAFIMLVVYTFSQSAGCSPLPTALPVNSTCVTTGFTNNDNGTTQTVNASCAGGFGTAYEDVWYSVTGTGNTMTITLSGSGESSVLAAFTGCGTGQLACATINAGASGSINFPTTNGTTYYIQIQRRSGGANTNQSGNICAVSAPAVGLANDNPCSATPLTVNASCSFSTYTNAGATATSGVPAPGCANYLGGDVWFTVTVPASGNIAVDMNTGVVTDGGMAIYSGTCGSLSLVACDDDGSTNGLMPFLQLSGQTPGATLWVRVWEYGNDNNGTFSICAYVPFVAPAPANDNCTGAIPATVNPNNLCGSVTPGTINGATTSAQGNNCGGTPNDDVWFSFVATNTTHYVDLLNVAGSTTDLYHSVYAASCAVIGNGTAAGNAIVCSDPNSSIVTGLTIGQTYYVRVYSWSSATGATTTFNLCIGTPPPPPANDNCTGAIPVTVSSSGCNSVTGSIASATASSQANGCGGTANDDVWYSFVATSAGAIVNLNNVAGSTTDLYHSVYAGTCGAPGAALVCSDPNTSTLTGLTIGNTYFVRIFSYGSTAGQTSTFDLCIQSTGPCGTPNNQDYCVAPAQLTQGPGTFSSNTSGTYTQDQPGNLTSVFCGSIENNSWYQFTATSTTHNFPITSVTGCTFGIQAQVYNVTEDVNGCCLSFASVSNCYNPANLTLGTVSATGLTIGNTYVLMIDGNGGAICDFTISGWSATGILPVELVDFMGIAFDDKNVLSWSTVSERDNDHFNVLKSADGIHFQKIGALQGAGNSTQQLNYRFEDTAVEGVITYYQLEQVDINNTKVKSDIITLTRSIDEHGILSVWPNPTKEQLTVEINSLGMQGNVVVIDIKGSKMYETSIHEPGYQTLTFNISDLSSGLYYILYTDQNGVTETRKITKN